MNFAYFKVCWTVLKPCWFARGVTRVVNRTRKGACLCQVDLRFAPAEAARSRLPGNQYNLLTRSSHINVPVFFHVNTLRQAFKRNLIVSRCSIFDKNTRYFPALATCPQADCCTMDETDSATTPPFFFLILLLNSPRVQRSHLRQLPVYQSYISLADGAYG